jgi:hypothetical protein
MGPCKEKATGPESQREAEAPVAQSGAKEHGSFQKMERAGADCPLEIC